MKTNHLTRMALLTAVALIIFTVEAQIPVPIPIPGVKLGLANVITLYSIFALGANDTWKILLCRIILGSIFTGQMMTCLFSLSGGILCFAVMLLMRRLVSEDQIWAIGACAGIAHNIGQLIAACLVLQSPLVFSYLVYLIPIGMITGIFTGLCAQFVFKRIGKRQ